MASLCLEPVRVRGFRPGPSSGTERTGVVVFEYAGGDFGTIGGQPTTEQLDAMLRLFHEAMEAGASDFLPKPFTPDELRAIAGKRASVMADRFRDGLQRLNGSAAR